MDGSDQKINHMGGNDTGSTGQSFDQNGESVVTEAEYQTIFETVEDAVFVFDVEYDEDEIAFSFRQNNPAHEELTNITPDEFHGDSPEEILGAEEGAEVTDTYRRCVETKEPIEYEESIDHPTGTIEWHTTISPIIEAGEVTRLVGVARDITERKRRERELERKQNRLRALFEEAPDGIVIHDDTGRILDINETICDKLGYTREELLSMEVFDFDISLDKAASKSKWQSMETGSMQRLEVEGLHRRKDGSTFPAEVWVSKVRDSDEKQTRFLALVRDITDRKERERELEQYERIIESASDVLWMFRDDFSETLFINTPYEELFGQSTATLQDDPLAFIEAVNPDDREVIRRQVEQISNGHSIDFELRVNPRENFGRWVWIKGVPIYNDDGDQCAVSGFVRDITEMKERQRRVQQFKEAIEQAAHAVYITDTEGNIEYLNPAFEEVTGYTEAEAMGETPSLLKSGEHDDQLYETLWDTILDGERWQNEMIDQRKDGEQIVLDQVISPLTNGDGEVEKFVAVAKDITERKERERQLHRHQTYLESANDMITLIEPDGTIEYVSSAVERILGFEPAELIGENGFEYVHPEDRTDRIEDINELADSPGKETVLEFRFQQADGGYRWIESTVRNLLDDPGVERLLLSSRDITDRKAYEQRLTTLHDATRRIIDAESKQDVAEITVDAAQELLEFSLPSVWYPTNDGTVLTLVANSPEHQTLLDEAGTPEPTHASDSWLWDVIESDETVIRSPLSPEDLAADVPLQSAILLPLGEHGVLGCGVRGETEFSDREIRIAEILARNVRTALDQLDQRAALERQKAFTDDLLDAIEDVVYVLNTDGDFEEWNVALEEVIGYESDEIESMNATEFFAAEDAEAVEAAVRESFETGRTRVELDFLSADGESIPYEFIANAFEDPTGEPVMAGIGRDRSVHVEYEEALEEQRDNLRVLNEVVRHDIRNDMTVVKGRANLLNEHIDPSGREDLQAVLDATENAIALTKTARDLSETMLSTEEDVQSVGLDQHLHAPIENARSKFDNAVITVEDRIPDIAVRGNELLEAVFRNLVQNAVVHNDKDVPEVKVETAVDEETVTVAVRDNGPGIPDSQKEAIFGKGEKGLDSPGTGIGLYLVRTLVDQYGGDVWVEDNDSEGSVFYVKLPRADEEHEP